MPFSASAIRVLIASPSDTLTARLAIRETIEDWSAVHAEATGVVLLPMMWERDATPELGDRGQGIINRELVDRCDVLVGAFWTRLGTPTGLDESGTAEEIRRCSAQGKPVLLYFCEADVPSNVDLNELARLRDFRTRIQHEGLVSSYSSEPALRRKLANDLTRKIRERFVGSSRAPIPQAAPSRAALRASTRRARRPDALDEDFLLVIENYGDGIAEDVRFQFVPMEDVPLEPPGIVQTAPVSWLLPGSKVSFYLVVLKNSAMKCKVVIEWREETELRAHTQILRLDEKWP